jgi:hypothetical protein
MYFCTNMLKLKASHDLPLSSTRNGGKACQNYKEKKNPLADPPYKKWVGVHQTEIF